jgi:hypothetical protein
MAFDAVPGGDPRGPWCPKCRRPVADGETSTLMHFAHGSENWHAECARPYWDKLTPALQALSRGFGG